MSYPKYTREVNSLFFTYASVCIYDNYENEVRIHRPNVILPSSTKAVFWEINSFYLESKQAQVAVICLLFQSYQFKGSERCYHPAVST